MIFVKNDRKRFVKIDRQILPTQKFFHSLKFFRFSVASDFQYSSRLPVFVKNPVFTSEGKQYRKKALDQEKKERNTTSTKKKKEGKHDLDQEKKSNQDLNQVLRSYFFLL